ncbi:MAG TPA: hypothetical protein VGG48_08260 [Rhizomicrobium sp.]|jgi:hypothetical protein
MGKYDKLGEHLRAQPSDEVPMSFTEIESIIGAKLPPKAQHQRAWWSNNPSNNVMTKVWRDAGFVSERVDIAAGTLVFKRVQSEGTNVIRQPATGMAENTREFEPAKNDGEKKPYRSPLWGAMKGTFTIEPGWDLTRPAMDPDEWEELLEAKLAKYDRLFADAKREGDEENDKGKG